MSQIKIFTYFILFYFCGVLHQVEAHETFTVTRTKFNSQFIKRSMDIELDHYYKLSVELGLLGAFYYEIEEGDQIEITEEYSIPHIPGKAKFMLTNLSTGEMFHSFGEQITTRWIPNEINYALVHQIVRLTHDYCDDDNHWDYWTSQGCWEHIIRTIGQPTPENWEEGDQILFIDRLSDDVWLHYN